MDRDLGIHQILLKSELRRHFIHGVLGAVLGTSDSMREKKAFAPLNTTIRQHFAKLPSE
jgi:hypothetical protein